MSESEKFVRPHDAGRLLFGLRLSECWATTVTFEPFTSHASVVEEARQHLLDGLWSNDPNRMAAAVACRQHPRRSALILHGGAVLWFLFEMLAALIPIPRIHQHEVAKRVDHSLRGSAKIFIFRWLRFRFALTNVVWEK
jgi:hypothetical protein